MSSSEDKQKRAQRLQRDQRAIKKQTKIAKEHGLDYKQPHRFDKHHALDCGNPKCIVCGNPRKMYHEKTQQEKSFEQTKDWDEN